MKLRVEHTTVFEYDGPAYETATEVRLKPYEQPDSFQRCLDFNLEVIPQARITHYTDFYGNIVHYFNLLHSLQRLEIKATSIVLTGPGRTPASRNDEAFLQDFLVESRYVRFDDAVSAMAERYARIDSPSEAAKAISAAIFEEFTYEPGVTDVHSTSQEVMALRRGVCQDFAHVMIAICRRLGTPARYVSGYLYGGEHTEEHDRASHAWCEVYCGEKNGWIAFDPTHRTLLVDERYIRIGTGRDYADVTLVRGTFKGNAKEKLAATVRVQAVDAGAPAPSS
jgi:transglutaminase-like putative cysteine protease